MPRKSIVKQSFYTKGEDHNPYVIRPFKSHVAEPGRAASIFQRNNFNLQENKPENIRTKGFSSGFHNKTEDSQSNNVLSLSEAKIIRAKQYSK